MNRFRKLRRFDAASLARLVELLGSTREPTDAELQELIEAGLLPQISGGAGVQFTVPFETVATSSTAKTVVGIKPAANQAVRVTGIDIGFDGTNSNNGPALIEIQSNTWATNAPGTNSTSVTPLTTDTGRPETVQTSCGKTWTTEPTVLTLIKAFNVPTYMGSTLVPTTPLPLTAPILVKGGGGLSVRVTLPTGVMANATGTLTCEE